jgi:phenylpyruvate tautomerase PptA (4-oxalocrotonate tautomerase family)
MPLLEITTNTAITNSQVFAEQASKLIAELLNKPESYVMIKIVPEQTLIFAGNNEPAAHIKLKSLGLAEDKTVYFSEKICSFINSKLNINSARIYIEFFNPARHMWGWDGKTF